MRLSLANRWHLGWLAAWSAAAAVWAGQAWLGLCDPLEAAWSRQARASVVLQPSSDLVIVSIDDASLQALGAWPWPRETHARLIDQLTAAGARRIVHTVPFVGAESRQALSQLERIASVVSAGPQLPEQERLLGLVQQSQTLLDGDGQLAQSIEQSHRTALAVRYVAGQVVDWPLAELAAGALGAGHEVFEPDRSGVVRLHPLQVRAGDRVVPSLASWAVSAGAPNPPAAIQPFWRAPADRRDLPQVPAAAVMNGTLGASAKAQLTGKTVFVGATTNAVAQPVIFLDAGSMYPVQALVQAGSALASGQWVLRPGFIRELTWVLAAAVLAYLAWLPRMAVVSAAAVTVLGVVLLLAGSHLAMSAAAAEVPVMPLVMALLAGHGAAWWVAQRRVDQARGLAPDAPGMPSQDAVSVQVIETAPVPTEPMRLAPSGDAAPPPMPPGSAVTQVPMQPAAQASAPVAPSGPTPARPATPVPIALADLPPLASRLSVISAGRSSGAPPAPPPAPSPARPATTAPMNVPSAVATAAASTPPAAETARGGRLPKLGRFQLLRELGRGAMGRVYLAEDAATRQTVAVKTLALAREFEGFALREARQRFQREAMAALRLRHPGIVQLVDAGEDHGYAWIAMELLHGHDLVRHTQRTQLLPVPEVLAIVACVADALAHAHAQGVVHRDIKPANVMYEPRNGEVKVTDFGIARITDAARTRTGLLFGSPSYMSPEHLAGGQVDGRSDIYSLGVLLFELLTGSLPLNGSSMAELMHAVAQSPAPDVRTRRPRLPEPVANVVALALEKRPELRYASAADMAADLRAVRELWQAAPPPPTAFAELGDVSIQGSVHDVAPPVSTPPHQPVESVALGHNQPG